jgi:adenylate cyclase
VKTAAVIARLRGVLRGLLPLWVVATLVALAVAAAVLGLRELKLLDLGELTAYDAFVRTRAAARDTRQDPRILIVAVTERDIQDLGAWPLPDAVLARTIEALRALGPRAIGIDIYRDVPVPPGSAELDAALRRDGRVVAVTKFAEGSSGGVRPPAALRGTEQIGFNDVVVDGGGTVRRALLFLDDGQNVLYSFPLRLALLYLDKERLGLGPDPADESMVRLGATTIRPLGPRDGPYVTFDAGGYQFLADFRGGHDPFPRVSLGSLLRGEVSADSVRDHVVLVGVIADSVKDDFYTPLRGRFGVKYQVPGVEVHAHFVSQLLSIALEGRRPLASPPEWMKWLWILVVSGLGVLLGVWSLKPWRLALTVAFGLVLIFGIAFVVFRAGWWWPVVPPGLAWLGATALVVGYQSYRESVERGMLMKLFSQHVSKEVAEAIWREREQFAHGGRPAPRTLTVTALFTDLTGFTTVSEHLGPEALMDWLNEYMDPMAQEISRHEGVIRQYAGDSIIALFGVPVPRTTDEEIARDAANAVRCALAMEQRLIELNHAWRAAGRPVTGMRVGIFTGHATSGTLGSRDRWEYVVVGDTMNTASRLESFDKELYPPDPMTQPCRILVGAPTLSLLGNMFEVEWVAEAHLKGKEQLVGIYRILGQRSASVPHDSIDRAATSRAEQAGTALT